MLNGFVCIIKENCLSKASILDDTSTFSNCIQGHHQFSAINSMMSSKTGTHNTSTFVLDRIAAHSTDSTRGHSKTVFLMNVRKKEIFTVNLQSIKDSIQSNTLHN